MSDKLVCVKIAVQHRFVSWLVILKIVFCLIEHILDSDCDKNR